MKYWMDYHVCESGQREHRVSSTDTEVCRCVGKTNKAKTLYKKERGGPISMNIEICIFSVRLQPGSQKYMGCNVEREQKEGFLQNGSGIRTRREAWWCRLPGTAEALWRTLGMAQISKLVPSQTPNIKL